MKLTIIISAYNESKTIEKVIRKIVQLKLPYKKEIIVVEDGSSDNTPQILKKLATNQPIEIIAHSKNLGKGRSISDALKQTTGQIVLIQDADLEYNPDDIPNLLRPFEDKNTKVVYGSRSINKNPVSHWTFNLGGQLLTTITNMLYRAKISDEATGYKLFRTTTIKSLKLKSKRFEFCPEVTAKIAKRGIKIVEVPITYNPRPISEKKIRWWDGALAIYYLIKYRFSD